MTTGQKTVFGFLGIIATLLAVILGLCLGWPLWVWGLVAALVSGTLLTGMAFAGRAQRAEPFPEGTLIDLPVRPVERREIQLTRVRLPSAERDYGFLLTATVRWCPRPEAPDRPMDGGALARASVVQRAEEVTRTSEPGRCSLVQHELSAALAVMLPDPYDLVDAHAVEVTLALDDRDQERLDRQDRREYLHSDVLRDTGSAVVWWLTRNGEQIGRTVDDLGILAQLTSAANNEEIPELLRELIIEPPAPAPEPVREVADTATSAPRTAADLLGDFFRETGINPDEEVNALMVDMLAGAAAKKDPRAAEEIRRRYGSIRRTEEEAAAPSPNGNGPAPAMNGAGPHPE
ncbi:phage holin family protein [Streptomyces albidoflavus]